MLIMVILSRIFEMIEIVEGSNEAVKWLSFLFFFFWFIFGGGGGGCVGVEGVTRLLSFYVMNVYKIGLWDVLAGYLV